MILLIDAGGMRSSAPLSSNTVPVSTSSRSACFACVSIPIPGLLGGSSTALAVLAFGLGLAASVGQPGTPATSTAAAIRDPAKRNSRRILISRSPYFAPESIDGAPRCRRRPHGFIFSENGGNSTTTESGYRVATGATERGHCYPLQMLSRQCSTLPYAVGEIPDRYSEISRRVPLHDGAEIRIDQDRRAVGAFRHGEGGFAFAGRQRAGIGGADPQPAPPPGRALRFEPSETRIEAARHQPVLAPALAAAPAEPANIVGNRRQNIAAVVPDVAAPVAVPIDRVVEKACRHELRPSHRPGP